MTGTGLGAPRNVDEVKPRAGEPGDTTDEESVSLERNRGEAHSVAAETSQMSTHESLDDEAVQIIRAHYLQIILDNLRKIQPHAQTTSAARYGSELIGAINSYIDNALNDPMVELMLAIYPALTDENHWADWSSEQFAGMYDILFRLCERPSVNSDVIDRAILRLEDKIGLDTLPFEVDPNDLN